ncbi:MAG: hypothetical protein KAR20_15690, partial [Candidatus Heimdallarchaeota archaeon]|nr:hypothetical protein [Candidatus Heimdallarchaeota archaeon]
MEAFPSIFGKRKFDDNFEGKEFQEEIEEGSIIYRLHFNTEFKRPQDQLDIDSKVDEIKLLAEEFSENPTNANAENLAKQSVNAERVFQNYFMQGQGKCEDIMKAIFGSENQRQTQKILSNEFTFYEGEDFEAMMRLEMCEECEWNYINLHMWIEGRFRHQEEEFRREYKDYKQMTEIELMSEIKQVLENTKQYLESGEYEKAQIYSESLNSINQAWSEKSNNVWDEVRVTFENQIDSMSEEDRHEFDQNYGWIKQDQQQRQVVKEIQKEKYEQRKAFYFNLFSEYDMKELYFTQTDFEKRLVEEFKEKGEEICNNNQDDNENGEVDCADSQCGGKICGAGTQAITSDNETIEVQVDFYCIQSVCQAKEEINESTEPICGNHICEEGEADTLTENGTCQSDCTFAECPKHDAIECSGKVIFEGEDENGCTLPPICIEETGICSTTEDCAQPTCGVAECIRAEPEDEEGICKIIELIGCTAECESWEQEIEECNNQKIVTKICENGQWQETGAECESSDCAKCGNECVSEEDISTMLCEESTEDFNCFKQDGGCTKEFLPEQPSPI